MNKRNFIAMGAFAALAACGGGAGDKAVEIDHAAIQKLMEETVQPTAEIYWGSAGWIVDADGEHDLTPTTEEGWAATLKSTQDLQQLGALLKTPKYAQGRGEDWIQFSDSLIEVSKQAEKTAVDRDSDAIFEVGGVVYRVCQSCHLAYVPEEMQAPQNAAEAEAAAE